MCHETCEKHDPKYSKLFFLGEFFDLCTDTNLEERKTKKQETLLRDTQNFAGVIKLHNYPFFSGNQTWWKSMVESCWWISPLKNVPFFGLVSRVLGSRLPLLIKPKPIVRITNFQVTLLTRCVTFYRGKSQLFTPFGDYSKSPLFTTISGICFMFFQPPNEQIWAFQVGWPFPI